MQFTKLFSSILDSTIWREPPPVKIVWVTMLAMCDRNGEIHASLPGLADRARVTLDECQDALRRFMAPDKYSRTKAFEGRRVEEIDGGWRLLNHEKYRALLSQEERREYNRRKQNEHRKKLRSVKDSSAGVSNCQEMSALSAHTEAEADTEAEREREAEGDPPAPAPFSRRERQRHFLQALGAITRDKAGKDLMPEWEAETKGLKSDQITAIFKDAVPGIQWPSQFRDWRAAKGNY